MARKKPIELMRCLYGELSGFHICAECCNFKVVYFGGKKLFKCRAYGITHSNSSDWAKKWSACGLFNNPIDYPVVSDIAKHTFSRIGIVNAPLQQVDGQTELW